MTIRVITAILAVYLFGSALANARMIIFEDSNKNAELSVVLRLDPFSEPIALEKTNQEYRFAIKDTLFAEAPVRTIYLVAKWSPISADVPARGVSPMELELPIRLRSWDDSDLVLHSKYFIGVGENSVLEYERIDSLSRQFERLVGSCLLYKHYLNRNVRKTYPHVQRSLSTCLDASRQISASDSGRWFIPFNFVSDGIIGSFSSDQDDKERLSRIYHGIVGSPFRDINTIELNEKFMALDCKEKSSYFKFINELKEKFPDSTNLYIDESSKIIAEKKRIVIYNCNN